MLDQVFEIIVQLVVAAPEWIAEWILSRNKKHQTKSRFESEAS